MVDATTKKTTFRIAKSKHPAFSISDSEWTNHTDLKKLIKNHGLYADNENWKNYFQMTKAGMQCIKRIIFNFSLSFYISINNSSGSNSDINANIYYGCYAGRNPTVSGFLKYAKAALLSSAPPIENIYVEKDVKHDNAKYTPYGFFAEIIIEKDEYFDVRISTDEEDVPNILIGSKNLEHNKVPVMLSMEFLEIENANKNNL